MGDPLNEPSRSAIENGEEAGVGPEKLGRRRGASIRCGAKKTPMLTWAHSVPPPAVPAAWPPGLLGWSGEACGAAGGDCKWACSLAMRRRGTERHVSSSASASTTVGAHRSSWRKSCGPADWLGCGPCAVWASTSAVPPPASASWARRQGGGGQSWAASVAHCRSRLRSTHTVRREVEQRAIPARVATPALPEARKAVICHWGGLAEARYLPKVMPGASSRRPADVGLWPVEGCRPNPDKSRSTIGSALGGE